MSKRIIKFWGDGCMNCKAIAPILLGVKAEYGDIVFDEINVKNEDMSAKYNIASLPTLVFEKDGKEVARMTGLKPKSLIVKKIQEVF